MRYTELLEFDDQTKRMADLVRAVRTFASGQGDTTSIQTIVYQLLTQDENTAATSAKKMTDGDPVYRQWTKWWQTFLQALEGFARKNNWEVANNGAWFQCSRPSQDSRNEHQKMYLTLDMSDPAQIQKVSVLLRGLDRQGFVGKVSFKIAATFSAFYNHRDSIVVHFGHNEERNKVQAAVQGAGFKTVDRASFGRSDFGKDASDETGKHRSDSELVAQRFVRNIEANRDRLKGLNDNNLKSVLSQLLKHISMAGTHRK